MTSTTVDGRISRATATRAPGPAPGATRGTALRLTRRGRAAVVLVALFAALVVLAMRGAPAASTDVVNHPHLQTVVVTPGDTLWSIAHRIPPASDPRATVAEIERLNALPDGGTIIVGQPLLVPR